MLFIEKEGGILKTNFMGIKKSPEQNKKRMSTPAFISSVVGVGLVIIVGAVLVGKSDTGQINVTATIQDSNQRNRDAQGGSGNAVEAIPEVFTNLPNGGLQPQVAQPESALPEVIPESATTSASTTEATDPSAISEERAVTTDITSEEGNTQNAAQ